MNKLFYTTAIAAITLVSTNANAAPSGAVVNAGTVNVNQTSSIVSGKTLTNTVVNQTVSNYARVTWNNFSSKAGESITFNQPNANAVIVNRVASGSESILKGSLTANGKVVILNDAGITFAAGSTTNVGALYASTAHNQTFNANNTLMTLSGATRGITNAGTINASGKDIAFMAPRITNDGTIAVADRGNVYLHATEGGTFDIPATSAAATVTPSSTKAATAQNIFIDNNGTVQARGGKIEIKSIQALSPTIDSYVNLSGLVDATKFDTTAGGGTILVDTKTDTNIDGRLYAQNTGEGDGGSITINSTGVVELADNARLNVNGGTTAPSSGSVNNSAGTITITRTGTTTETGDKLIVNGRLLAMAGNTAKTNTGSININNNTSSGNIVIGSAAQLSTESSLNTAVTNGGINITGTKGNITVSGLVSTDSNKGSANAGNIVIRNTAITGNTSTIDLTNAVIRARAGTTGTPTGNGGNLTLTNTGGGTVIYKNSTLAPSVALSKRLSTGSNGTRAITASTVTTVD